MNIEFSEEEIERFKNSTKPVFSAEEISVLENYTDIDMDDLQSKFDWKSIQNKHLEISSKYLEMIHKEKIARWKLYYPEESHPYGTFEKVTR